MTTKTTHFNNSNVAAILEECRKALEPVAERHGLTLDRKGRTYHRDALPVMFQLLIKETDADGNVMDSKAKDFVRCAAAYGLSEKDYLAEFRSNGETFRITGLKPRARKYPVLAENVRTGKTYKFTAGRVREALARARAA